MNAIQKSVVAVRQHGVLYLFILPAILIVALFQYYPAASGAWHSLFRWNGADISEWVGAENYLALLSNEAFWSSFKLAFLLGIVNVFKMVPAIMIAVCIHRVRSERIGFLYRVLLVAPMVVPPLIIALIWRAFFFETTTGVLNSFLNGSGLKAVLDFMDTRLGLGVFVPGVNPAWLGDPKLVVPAIMIWGFPWVGSFAVLIHLSKLRQISREIYEAADIDGIGWFGKFLRIELPLIMGSVQLLLVFVIIDTVKDAGMVLALTNLYGGPGGVAMVPALYMLQRAFIDQQFGAACAAGIILTAVVLMLQKISELFVAREELSPLRQRVLSAALGVIGLLAIVPGNSPSIGLFLIAIVVPWRWLAAQIKRRLPAPSLRVYVPRRPAVRSLMWRRFQDLWPRALKHATIGGVLLLAYFPMWLMLVVSFKTNVQFYAHPLSITSPLVPANWQTAFSAVLPSVANTLFVAGTATVAIVFLGLLAAYFFARKAMPGSGLLWNLLLILMMMPTIANLIPLFRLLGDLHLLNTLTALILIGTSGGVVFATFVLRRFVSEIPKDLFEAADIDGAGHVTQVFRIVLPLSGAALGTVAIMQFIAIWNDFVLPLVVIRDADRLPVMVQLLRMSGDYIKLWGPLMAGYLIASLPVVILFILSMRLFVRGLNDGAVKG